MSDASVQVKLEDRPDGGAIALVSIDNQRRLNCFPRRIIVELAAAFDASGAEPALRAVVLTGAGEQAFIGGADLNELGGLCADSARLFITRLHDGLQGDPRLPGAGDRPNQRLLPRRGPGDGGQLRLAGRGRHARSFGMPEVHMGMPSVIEAALLPGLIGWGRTREMLLTGEPVFGGRGARHGLRAEGRAGAPSWTRRSTTGSAPSAERNAQAIRAQKALMNRWERVSIEEGIYAGIDALSSAYTTGEPQAAIKAFFANKRRQ